MSLFNVMERVNFEDKDVDQLMRDELHDQGVIYRCQEVAKKLKRKADTGLDTMQLRK